MKQSYKIMRNVFAGGLGTVTGCALFYVGYHAIKKRPTKLESLKKLDDAIHPIGLATAAATSSSKTSELGLQLKLVQVYCRHGARTPIGVIEKLEEVTYSNELIMRVPPKTMYDIYITELGTGNEQPGAPLQENYDRKPRLKGGSKPGSLTGYGHDQMYELGLRLRNDYFYFVSKEFKPSEVVFRSTNIERTIASLRCVLAGLYGRDELLSKGPINIPVSNDLEEVLFPNSHNCRVVRQIVHAAMVHFDDVTGIEEDRKIIENVLKMEPGTEGYRKINFIGLRDDLIARQTHGYCLPPVIVPYMEMIEKNAVKLMVCAFSGQYNREKTLALRLNVGLAVGMSLDKMEAKIQGKSEEKICLYSTHDSTLVALLCSLDCFDKIWPPFAADVRFELFEDKDKNHWVKVLYCGKEQVVRGCRESLVRYEEFIKNMRPMSIDRKEYNKICNSNILEKIAKGLLAHEAGEIEDEKDKDVSDKPAGM